MYFRLGPLNFPSGEVRLQSLSERSVASRRGVNKIAKQLTVDIDIIADGQSAINSRLGTLQSALNSSIATAGFVLDNGSNSRIMLEAARSINGIQIESFAYTQQDGAEHATHQSCTLTLSAEYPYANAGELVEYREEITVQGNGGPTFAIVPTLEGPPHRYQLTDQSPVVIVQTGSAVALYGYPFVNSPIFPEYEQGTARAIKRGSPEWDGRSFTNFPVAWGYTFILGSMPSVPSPLAR